MSQILIAAGGTGGHMFPAISVADHLSAQGQDVAFITDQRGEQYLKPEHQRSAYNLSALGWRRWWSIPYVCWQMTLLGVCVFFYFLFSRPDRVIGFGGYASYPVLWMARLFRVPYFIHEQNSVMGIVNRKFAASACKVMTSFPHTIYANDKVVCTGLPVRKDILQVREIAYVLSKESFHILVLGGSQGAGIFSEILPKALALLPKDILAKLCLVQHCRAEDIKKVEKQYLALGVKAQLVPFIDHIAEELSHAHLVISRAGASTVAELTVTGRPALLVPYPHAMDDHQTGNAFYVSSHQSGWLVKQSEFTPERVASFLTALIANPTTLVRAATAMKSLGQSNAVEEIAKQVTKGPLGTPYLLSLVMVIKSVL